MPTVFISHSSKDSDFIERNIIPALEANGVDVWFSLELIETADKWERSVTRGLESSEWFVVAISPNSVKSEWVYRETSWAFRNRKGKIIPVLIGEYNPDDLYLGLQDLQCVDCIGDPKMGAEELALLLATKAAVTGKSMDYTHSQPWIDYTHALPWKWTMTIIVVLLAAAVSRLLWPTSNVLIRALGIYFIFWLLGAIVGFASIAVLLMRLLPWFWEKRNTVLDNQRTLTEAEAKNGDRTRPVSSVKEKATEYISPSRNDPSPLADEDVQFTVYRPQAISPKMWKKLLVFAHHASAPPEAPPDALDPVKEVERQAIEILGNEIREYANVSQDASNAIPRDGLLTFLPEVEGVTFQPKSQSVMWQGRVPPAIFLLSTSSEFLNKTLRGQLCVFLGNIIVAQVSISFRVEHATARASDTGYVREIAPWYRRVFASYSHLDTAIVEEFERHAVAFGDEYLRDVSTLRAGMKWNDNLRQMIHQADIFQLFWSRNSMNSDYVRQEYSYALGLHRDGFVRPVYWEDPMPESKEKKLPPPELQEIHFHRISPLTRTEPGGQQGGLERTMPGSSPMQTADLRTLRSIKLVGVVAFFSISLVALGMGIYWRARTHSSPEGQIAKSAHNDGSPVSGMPSVSVDVGGPVTTLPAVPPIFHEAENIPGHGAATTKPPSPPIFHEAEIPPPPKGHGAASTNPPSGALNELAPPRAVPLKPVDTYGMVRIPGGKFNMGSPEKEVGRVAIESPQHHVSVDAFMMDETEVTYEMYKRFVMDKPEWQKGRVPANRASQFYLENWEGTQYLANKEKYPVAYVSWYAARAYCEWVNKRLPTEAEWEYAARAGTTTAFWWGDEWNGKFANASRQSADAVGNPDHRNKFGLFDMLGNVWEWTSTLYSRYPYNAKDGREDQNSSAARVMRGGSWGVESDYLRSATRVREPSEFTREDVGFRCAYSGP